MEQALAPSASAFSTWVPRRMPPSQIKCYSISAANVRFKATNSPFAFVSVWNRPNPGTGGSKMTATKRPFAACGKANVYVSHFT
jgi:hypothetical protein